MNGFVHSYETLGTLDGPGIRTVVFLRGCPLRCVCCHNPDTWQSGGVLTEAHEVYEKVLRYKNYFGSRGGITLSGGEPLMQIDFAKEIFSLCRAGGITTCLDTSGCVCDENARSLIELCDTVLLDIKYTNPRDYKKYTGMEMQSALDFLGMVQSAGKQVYIRQVIIEGLNDTDGNIDALAEIANAYSCVAKVELLAFRKLCAEKYKKLGIKFPLENTPETPPEKIKYFSDMLSKKIKAVCV